MKVVLTPPGFEFGELAPVFVDVAAIGSLLAVLTTDGLYVLHIDRLELTTDAGTRAMIARLADRGMNAHAISRQLGIGVKAAQFYHPRAYASQKERTQARSPDAGRNAQPIEAPEARSLRGQVGEDRADLGANPKGKNRDRRGLGAARRRRAGFAPAG